MVEMSKEFFERLAWVVFGFSDFPEGLFNAVTALGGFTLPGEKDIMSWVKWEKIEKEDGRKRAFLQKEKETREKINKRIETQKKMDKIWKDSTSLGSIFGKETFKV